MNSLIKAYTEAREAHFTAQSVMEFAEAELVYRCQQILGVIYPETVHSLSNGTLIQDSVDHVLIQTGGVQCRTGVGHYYDIMEAWLDMTTEDLHDVAVVRAEVQRKEKLERAREMLEKQQHLVDSLSVPNV